MFKGSPTTHRSTWWAWARRLSSERSAESERRRTVVTGWAVSPNSSETAPPMVRVPRSRPMVRICIYSNRRSASWDRLSDGLYGSRPEGAPKRPKMLTSRASTHGTITANFPGSSPRVRQPSASRRRGGGWQRRNAGLPADGFFVVVFALTLCNQELLELAEAFPGPVDETAGGPNPLRGLECALVNVDRLAHQDADSLPYLLAIDVRLFGVQLLGNRRVDQLREKSLVEHPDLCSRSGRPVPVSDPNCPQVVPLR